MGSKLTFRQLGHGQVVELDGEDISPAVAAFGFTVRAHELPQVELDLAVIETEIDTDAARIHITEETVVLLKRLGWTPPAEEA